MPVTPAVVEATLAWFDEHRRTLPWRESRDPYAIWVSEIMLQQTQVKTVIPYFERWMATFPTAAVLAAADEQAVLAMWQGLGYYRRCRQLLNGARFVARNGMPASATGWREVPGVGPYTAGAIASIAFGEPAALVDGNVERVFARLTACPETGPKLNRRAWEWAQASVPAHRPGDWNQALMEIGATVCRPRDADCPACPLRPACLAADGDPLAFPTAVAKKTPTLLQHETWIPVFGDRVGIRQIPEGEWWHGMWEFPRTTDGTKLFPGEKVWPLGSFRHTVTTHRITMIVYAVRVNEELPELRWLTPKELDQVPLPAPQRKAFGLLAAAKNSLVDFE
jgi:A/G-specific adenine glycosylase